MVSLNAAHLPLQEGEVYDLQSCNDRRPTAQRRFAGLFPRDHRAYDINQPVVPNLRDSKNAS